MSHDEHDNVIHLNRDGQSEEVRIGVYTCHCGTNIAATIDVHECAKVASNLPGVVLSREYKYMCSDPGQELIKKEGRKVYHRQHCSSEVDYTADVSRRMR